MHKENADGKGIQVVYDISSETVDESVVFHLFLKGVSLTVQFQSLSLGFRIYPSCHIGDHWHHLHCQLVFPEKSLEFTPASLSCHTHGLLLTSAYTPNCLEAAILHAPMEIS